MSGLDWREEERLLGKISRLEDELSDTMAALEASRSDHAKTEKELEAALAEIARLQP